MNKTGSLTMISRWLMATAFVVVLTACDNDMSDLDAYIADVKARPAEPIPPIPPVKTYTPYVYEGQTGRDPFRPSTSEGSDDVAATASSTGPRPDRDRAREYLVCDASMTVDDV